jgi:DNA-binding NarL/FixJ family response regulator
MTPPQRIRILIVDDHSMVRIGMTGLLAMESDMDVVAEAEDLAQAVAAFTRHRPDVTLMDVRMPDGSGLEALARIRTIDPGACVVMLSTFDLEQPITAAHDAGAVGYLLKSITGSELAAAIRRVHTGESCFPAALQDHLAARAGSKPLTPRELETLDLLRRGLSNKDIGHILAISENTAKFHVKAILAKLDVTDRAEAVAAAFERGLLEVD